MRPSRHLTNYRFLGSWLKMEAAHAAPAETCASVGIEPWWPQAGHVRVDSSRMAP